MTVVACNYPSPSERPELEPARKVKERERQVRGRSAKAPPTLDADVHQELEATDALLGDPDAVRAFVFDAAQRLAISVTVDKHPDVFRVACGYEDCDDLDALRFDPAFKLACGRLAETGDDLMSQPTLSRLENAPSWRELARMGLKLIDLFCAGFKAVPERIVLDIDDTADAVHGGQQLALFNAHYDDYCFQPIHIFEAATGKPVLSLLRPGKRPSGEEVAQVLKHVIRRIRHNWPRVQITVRGDGHYGTPEVMEFLEDQGCGYIFGLSGNARLSKIGHPWCEDAAVRRARQGKDKLRRFFQTGYQAKSWSRERTVIARVEATSKGSDIRFIVTNLNGKAKVLYEKVYCARGRMENMIKEHKLYTKSDRTSCHRWEANQFRLFLHTGAYWLLHQLRQATAAIPASHTRHSQGQSTQFPVFRTPTPCTIHFAVEFLTESAMRVLPAVSGASLCYSSFANRIPQPIFPIVAKSAL